MKELRNKKECRCFQAIVVQEICVPVGCEKALAVILVADVS